MGGAQCRSIATGRGLAAAGDNTKKKKIILPFDLYESSLAEAWEKERDDFSWAKLDAIAR